MKFYKKNPNDTIWWVEDEDIGGIPKFSFDKETIYNVFKDYPDNLTAEQLQIFEKENPYWVEYFK